MGVYDRDYLQDDYGTGSQQVRIVRPSLPPVVKWLLIINIAVYLVCAIIQPIADVVYTWGSVYPESWGLIGQVWRFISYQFLHDLRNFFHVLFNMMVLYFFGPLVEQLWGSKRFLKFYLCAGAAGGIIYTLLVIFGVLTAVPMVGASGALYGILGAVAMLFPHAQVFLFGIIPMSMRTLAILSVIISLLRFAGGTNAGGEAAHLTGMAIGVLYVLYQPLVTSLRMKKHKNRWQENLEKERLFESEVDRILEKVHQEGLPRLTRKEKEILQEATRREQEQLRKP
jgi:membrane associated rhomboid family serine protease